MLMDGDRPWRNALGRALARRGFHVGAVESVAEAIATAPNPEDIAIRVVEKAVGPEPEATRRPEMRHALSALIHNAIQFARTHVEIGVDWYGDHVTLTIDDDGPGFDEEILPLLGEPYMSTRHDRRGHMGLGVFIAQTLLARTGGSVGFANRRDSSNAVLGARVLVRWRRADLTAEA